LVNAAGSQVNQLVAQGANPGWRQCGVVSECSKEVTRVGLEGQHATGYAALLGLAFEQGQHGLVATVHTIEITYRQGA